MSKTELFVSKSTQRVRTVVHRSVLSLSVLFVSLLSTVSASAVGSLKIAWDPSPASGLSGYRVRYGTTSGQFTMSTNVGNVTSATIGGLQDGMTYYLVVTAVNSTGMESDPSNQIGYSMPLPNGPSISAIASQTTAENVPVTVAFTVSSPSTPTGNLTLSASSSNTGLLPVANIVFSGTGSNRTAVLTPWAGRSGTATVVFTVNDGTMSASRSFTLTVNAINNTPTLAAIASRTISEDAGAQTIALSGISTGDSNELQTLTVTATSSNPSLIPNPSVSYTSPSATGTLTFTPVANGNGTATISVRVNDGQTSNNLATQTFTVTVNPVNDVPTLSATVDQNIVRDTSSAAIGFTVGDPETAVGSLTLSAVSSNPTLVPVSGIVFGGSGANRTVTITPASGQTGSASVTVTVSDGSATASDTFVVTVSPPGVGPKSFTNQTAITIADVGAGTPYPSPINVSGMAGTISQVTLTLKGISHTYPDDIDVLLVGPSGQKIMVLSDVGGGTGVNGMTISLSDSAASLLPDGGPLASGTFRPTDASPGEARDVFPAPAPAGPYSASLASLNGQSPNGTWSLYVNDDGDGDQGLVSGGWTLTITTTATANSEPTITDIGAQSTSANTPTAAISFTVNDAETPTGSLVLAGSSSNPTLVANAGIVFGGTGSSRTVTITPTAGQSGISTITVTVTDAAGASSSDTFTITVVAATPPPTIVLTSPTSGASHLAPATIGVAASVTANGNTIAKVQFYNGSTLLGEATAAPYGFNWTNVAIGNYTVNARVVYGAGSTVTSIPASVAVVGLPAPWQSVDIGAVGIAGSAWESGGTYSVSGAGNISGAADKFRFVHQPLSGDGSITFRVASIDNTGANGRVGVMIRNTLTSGSKYAFMGLTPDGTVRWQRRSSTSGSTSSTISTAGTVPNVWVRLVRTGNTIYGYRSDDGVNWTLVNSRNISMSASIYIGLAVASGSSTVLNTSTFSSATVVP